MSSLFILEAINIHKHFGELIALDNVTLRLRKGSFHALLGENGAGKSTLVKCIMGYYQPSEGEVLFGDKQQKIHNPQEALTLGVGMVYQHFTLIPNMTVAENIVLSRPQMPAVVNWAKEMALLSQRMEEMPFQIPLDVPVTSLSAGEKQKLEIIKQLMLNTQVLILDEPSSVLTPTEADEVLGMIRDLTINKGLSVLIITHKFREVMNFADEVTVLRKGEYIGTKPISEVSPEILAEMMIGSKKTSKEVERVEASSSNIKVSINDLKVNDDVGVAVLQDLSLRLRHQEIVGIAGVSGNGQKELLQVFAGQRQAESGTIKVSDEVYTASREQMFRFKLHCLPEEPLKNACVGNMSVAENLVFRNFDRSPFSLYKWLLNRKAINRNAKRLIDKFSIKTPSPDNAIANLSGGNVQRAVLARELAEQVEILVVANPCFGLDFGAVEFIHKQIMMARNKGAAVLLISEDLDEILELSDRIFVISEGKLVYETTPEQAEISTLGKYMAGHQ